MTNNEIVKKLTEELGKMKLAMEQLDGLEQIALNGIATAQESIIAGQKAIVEIRKKRTEAKMIMVMLEETIKSYEEV